MLPTGVALPGTFTFRKSGVLADPSPLPTAVSEGLYPDATLLSPLPVLTHIGTGRFQATAFSAVQNASAGVYTASVYSADTTLDSQTSALYWEVDTSYLAAIFAYAASAVTTAGSASKYILDTLASILLKTDLITQTNVTFTSPVAEDLTTTLYYNRDFDSSDGLSLDYPVNVTLDALTDTVTWYATGFDGTVVTVAGSVLSAREIRVSGTAANTVSIMDSNNIDFETTFEAVVTRSGRTLEIVAGPLLMRRVVYVP